MTENELYTSVIYFHGVISGTISRLRENKSCLDCRWVADNLSEILVDFDFGRLIKNRVEEIQSEEPQGE